ncbi:MAG: MurR/RpiR family transcriptional regulator [Flavobacteriaceae bacterium]
MDQTVAEEIRGRLDRFTATERRAAHALLANYPLIGLQTVAEFAGRVGVSAPTILRFIGKLGFPAYADFQRRLHEELEAQLKTPLAKSPQPGTARDGAAPRHDFVGAVTANMQETFRHLPPAEFDAVVALLANEKLRIHLVGGRFTDALARYMTAHLRIVRPRVAHIDGQEANWPDQLIDFGRRDVLVIFDIRRYQETLLDFARAAEGRGVTIVLFTDQWLSPVSRVATHILAARIAVPSAWDSSAAIMALAEAVLAAVTEASWQRSAGRMSELEALRGRGKG